MEKELSNVIKEGIETIGLSWNPELQRRLEILYDEITLFNPSYKLVGASGYDLVTRHILDSLAPAPLISKVLSGNSVGDLGSGSGLPGIVLASAMENINFTLVERMGRRAGFLRNTLALTGLVQKTKILECDLKDVRDTFDGVVFRAFRPLEDIIADLHRIVVPQGNVFAYKSSDENLVIEKKALENYERKIGKKVFDFEVISYEVPFCNSKRCLMVLHRIG
ncbi:MAG: class I SAM-dependent methyltransferase [Sphaerochaetaceae bacterium]|nr:class I SAM-dependent methyltransferase [Sphaerochaetaceae bacterium]